jgi:hypothetical protein
MYNDEDSDYGKLRNQGTGSHETRVNYKLVVYPFDRYLITVKLDQEDRFVGIEEVKLRKDFLSYRQKMPDRGFHDVEEFYKE